MIVKKMRAIFERIIGIGTHVFSVDVPPLQHDNNPIDWPKFLLMLF